MRLSDKRILLTGASGGLGQALVKGLLAQGAKLVIVGRNAEQLTRLGDYAADIGGTAIVILNDFAQANAAETVVMQALSQLGGLDILINGAGTLDFINFAKQDSQRIAQIMHINTVVPMQLARAILPYFLEKDAGKIINVGSIYGVIGFPHYVSYSASKFALRGFSQALRRELFDSKVQVTYIAPRAINTNINNTASKEMLLATKANVDSAESVAHTIIKSIYQNKAEQYIGQPESLFAWLNSTFPTLISQGLKKTTLIARQFIS